MMSRQPVKKTIPARAGYTFVELLVSIGAATILMAGLPSCIFIVTQAFSGQNATVTRATTSEIQADIFHDLKHALSFDELTVNAVTITVPDRDNDNIPEKVRYAWSGRPGDPLVYQYNTRTAVNLVEDVHSFNLSNITRFIAGPSIPAPEEIAAGEEILGFDTVFSSNADDDEDRLIATQVTLNQAATLLSITAYIETDDNEFGFAIYSDSNGEPDQLLASTAITDDPDGGNEGWKTLAVPETALDPGNYWLVLALDHRRSIYWYESGTGQSRVRNLNPFVSNQFASSWGTSNSSSTKKLSIYGTCRAGH